MGAAGEAANAAQLVTTVALHEGWAWLAQERHVLDKAQLQLHKQKQQPPSAWAAVALCVPCTLLWHTLHPAAAGCHLHHDFVNPWPHKNLRAPVAAVPLLPALRMLS